MGTTRRATLTLVLGWTSAAACGEGVSDPECNLVDPFPYAILVDVRSRVTDERITEGVEVRLVGGSMEVLLTPLVTGKWSAMVPAGTYDVFVQAEGFRPWEARGVETRWGACGGFDPVELEARLDHAPRQRSAVPERSQRLPPRPSCTARPI
jgi:hypothetical protein